MVVLFKAELLMFLSRNMRSNIVSNVIYKAFHTAIYKKYLIRFQRVPDFRQMLCNGDFLGAFQLMCCLFLTCFQIYKE